MATVKTKLVAVLHEAMRNDQAEIALYHEDGLREYLAEPNASADVHTVIGEFIARFCLDEDGVHNGRAHPVVVAHRALTALGCIPNAARFTDLKQLLLSGDCGSVEIANLLREIAP